MRIEPFQLERYFAEYEFTAPYLLCSSDCESLSVGDLLSFEPGGEQALHSLWLGYTESAGHPALRDAIATLYETVSPADVLVHAGAEEAIFNFINVTVEPADHVIVQAPYYQSLDAVARGVGAEVTPWRGDPNQGWALSLDQLEALLTDRTRLVIINVPHNPTGFLPTVDFMRSLAELAEARGFVVFSDEVYRGLEHTPDRRLPAYADLDARGVSLGVMSKTYGLAGLRIGWVATRNREIRAAMAQFKDYTTICNSAPSELLATMALKHRDIIVQRNLEIIRSNLDRLDAFFSRHTERFAWYRPEAGPIAFPKYLGESVDTFCRSLVDEVGVLLLPGTVYEPGSDCFRIGFGRKNLPEALERLEGYLAGL